jgi:hypothetical protein
LSVFSYFLETEITEALMGQRRDRATTREIVADLDSSFGEKVRTIAACPWFKVSNEGLQLGGPALDREGNLLSLEIYGRSVFKITREKNDRSTSSQA